MAKRGVEKYTEDVYILKDANAALVVEGNQYDSNFGSTQTLNSGNKEWAYWGSNNLRPQDVLKLVYQNHFKPQLLVTARDFLIGQGIEIFRKVLIERNGKKEVVLEPAFFAEGDDWLESIEVHDYLLRAGHNVEHFNNVFTVLGLQSKTMVESLECFDCTDVRAKKVDKKTGKIPSYYICSDWRIPVIDGDNRNIQEVPTFDKTKPTKFAYSMIHGRDYVPGQFYYDVAAWWGTEKWTEVSNLIAIFHLSGLKNGYNIKYIIKIPKGIFDNLKDKDGKPIHPLEAEKNYVETINEFLAGVENANKAVVSKFTLDSTGKEGASVQIIPLDNKMSDTAYDSVNSQANQAHASGHGIDPSLAGVDYGNKLGGSGSEKRIAYQLHIALRTFNKRMILLKPLNIAKKIMGWDRDLVFWFKDMDIVTLADNPKGQQPMNTQQPSTPQ